MKASPPLRRPVRGRRQVQHLALVVLQFQRDRKTTQGDAPHDLVDVPELGRLRPQELAARRRVVKEVLHIHRGTGRMCGGHGRRCAVAAVTMQRPAGIRLVKPGGQLQTRYRGDAGQGLAAKTHAADLFEILQRGDLAGRMARQCKLQLPGRYADPVVADADAPLAALLDIHLDGRRPGIDTVFQ